MATLKTLLQSLKDHGISDKIIQAFSATPRHQFVSSEYQNMAYYDNALPIACDQTISQPYVVAFMTQALSLEPTDRVLEVGTGSGYQAAILAHCCDQVYTIERHKPLLEKAKEHLSDYDNISFKHDNGVKGWPEKSPFDRIIVTAGTSSMPMMLVDQLIDGGQMVLPLGYNSQMLVRVTKTGQSYQTEELIAVVFVPLIDDIA